MIKFLQVEKGKNRDIYRDDKFLIQLEMESNTISTIISWCQIQAKIKRLLCMRNKNQCYSGN